MVHLTSCIIASAKYQIIKMLIKLPRSFLVFNFVNKMHARWNIEGKKLFRKDIQKHIQENIANVYSRGAKFVTRHFECSKGKILHHPLQIICKNNVWKKYFTIYRLIFQFCLLFAYKVFTIILPLLQIIQTNLLANLFVKFIKFAKTMYKCVYKREQKMITENIFFIVFR